MLVSRYTLLYFIGLLSFFITGFRAGAQKISFDHLSVEQGLSQSSVLCITQDDKGFIWLGTRYGLNRFDGTHVVVYKNNPADSRSLSNNYINTLFFDLEGTLWVGTANGLDIFNAASNSFARIYLPGFNKDQQPEIYGLAEGKKEELWLGTSKGLFYCGNTATVRFIPAPQQEFPAEVKTKAIQKLFTDSKEGLWVATFKHLYHFSKTSDGYKTKEFKSDPADPSTLSDDVIQSIAEDKTGKIWIGTMNGLNCYDPVTGKFKSYRNQPSGNGLINNNVRSLVVDKSGKLWIGTQEGISIMNPVTRQIESLANNAEDEKSLSQNSVHSIFEDANGSIWIGTFFGGANVTHAITTSFTAWQHRNTKSSISNNVVSSIVADENNNLWIGTEGGGLNFYNRATGQFKTYKNEVGRQGSLNSNLVKTVFIDKDKNIWVGTHGGGLNLFNPKTQQFKYYLNNENRKHSEVEVLFEDSQHRFWVGNHSGLKVFERDGTNLSSIGYEDVLKNMDAKNISALAEDQHHNIWIGALEGLFLFRHTTKTIKPVSILNKTSPNINCILADTKGNVWIGLYNDGFAQYNNNDNTFTVYTTANGLPNNNVLGILEDDRNQLWLSTGNGLARFDPVAKTFQTYTTSDGLAGNEFNNNAFYKNRNGELFFGGMKGLTSFFPGKIERNTKASSLVFTGLKIFNTPVVINDEFKILHKDIGQTDHLRFSYQQNTFTIEFALLNFVRPDKNKYAYKLEGVHKDWTAINTPSATFTNLPAGNYTLQIKGVNNDGVLSQPVSMKITVSPPFWKTSWAYLLYALFVAAIVFLVVRFFYIRALLRRDKELHEIKLNFFTNISHEIRTHLTLIMAPIEKMQQENAHNNVLQHHLDNARKNASRLLKLVTELMDFRKAESHHLKLHIANHDLIAFLNDIYTSFEDVSLAKNIRASFVHDASAVNLYFDREQMEKVIYNLLTNAFKFTPPGGAIALHVESKGDKVKIHITDNGKGIAPQHLDKLFTNYFQVSDNKSQSSGYGIGLALSKTIVELHHGGLTVESTPATRNMEGSTCFTVTLLKGHEHFGTTELSQDITKNIATPENEKQTERVSNTAAEPEEKRYNILVTEDNDELRNLIKNCLRQYNVSECVNGVEGWEAATEEIPDLIISDVMMPEMDGFMLCQKLKTDERTSHIPVILLTAKSSQSDQVTGLDTGADLYLTKPFSTQVLELSVRNLLAAREKMRLKFSREFVLQPQNITINTVDEQFLTRLIGVIEEYMDHAEFNIELLSTKMMMSQSVLYKKIRALTDMSANDFAKMIRLKRAAQLLQQGQYSVFEVSVMVGFNDRKYFSKEFKKQFGKTPSEFIQSDEVSE
ncbi:hybrid sensor histidine kinase/response regulator transcription factor [Pinibacter soli]|uniref:histidine kinase n=1 Tax=Pinibacter soli TaxID=3044211 RepID=A0ABT6RFF5_9BACT|nr:hybrid sensor histidine kinase/response regulator transcription factor [Pinibacter soli]MDI3321290.1 two-component regulator propeller domain-containing protein [Pinibacter soli]